MRLKCFRCPRYRIVRLVDLSLVAGRKYYRADKRAGEQKHWHAPVLSISIRDRHEIDSKLSAAD